MKRRPPDDDEDVWRVWNRAAMAEVGPDARPGDEALASLLRWHGMAMNGGCAHAFEALSAEERGLAARGYRFFGLDDAAAVVEWLEHERPTDRDDDAAERLEAEADERYWAAVPGDDVLVRAVEACLDRTPDAFAPTSA